MNTTCGIITLKTSEWSKITKITRIHRGCVAVKWWLEFHSNQQTRRPPIQSDKYQCRIDKVISPDNGHMVARNM